MMQRSCFRAMFPTADPTRLASAQAFCQTYTQGVSTATTGFIPRFTTACSSDPSKYSSACSCGPTATATAPACAPTPYEVFQNGDFECGIYPWRALVTDGTTYALTSPGFSSSTTFEVRQNGPLDIVGLGQANIQQLIYITPGVQYTLKFSTFWSPNGVGFIGLKFNGQPQYTFDAGDNNGPGVWSSNTVSFTATTGQYLLEFEFLFGATGVVAKIDNVVLTPGT